MFRPSANELDGRRIVVSTRDPIARVVSAFNYRDPTRGMPSERDKPKGGRDPTEIALCIAAGTESWLPLSLCAVKDLRSTPCVTVTHRPVLCKRQRLCRSAGRRWTMRRRGASHVRLLPAPAPDGRIQLHWPRIRVRAEGARCGCRDARLCGRAAWSAVARTCTRMAPRTDPELSRACVSGVRASCDCGVGTTWARRASTTLCIESTLSRTCTTSPTTSDALPRGLGERRSGHA
jgi:hypothetical protein